MASTFMAMSVPPLAHPLCCCLLRLRRMAVISARPRLSGRKFKRFAGQGRAFNQGTQFGPGDLRMRAAAEPAIRAGDHVLPADAPGVALQPLRHELRML